MYKHLTSDFGDFTQHELINRKTNNRIAIIPEFSACVLSIQLKGIEVLDAYQTPREMTLNRWFKNLPLFPFPNRLNQGQYKWKDNIQQLPINDTQTGNALHGFSAGKEFEVINVVTEEDYAAIHCRYEYDGSMMGYPFPFQFDIIFRLSDEDGMSIRLSATNTGNSRMPFGLGWHPYFQLSKDAEQIQLQLPLLELVGVDENMIPTGKRYIYDRFTDERLLGAEVLDNCFAIKGEKSIATVSLNGEHGKLTYWQECGTGKYPYIQLFTPPHRQSVAIEPMSCNIDAFNNQDGLWILEPRETGTAKFGFQLS